MSCGCSWCGTLGFPAVNTEASAVYGLSSVGAGSCVKRRWQWYREVGEASLHDFLPCLIKASQTLPVCPLAEVGCAQEVEKPGTKGNKVLKVSR